MNKPTKRSPLLENPDLKATYALPELAQFTRITNTQSTTSTNPPLKLVLIAIAVCMGGSFHFGFQLVITNPTQQVFIDFVNRCHIEHYGEHLGKEALDTLWSTIVALLFVGALFGSFVLRLTAEKLGRKNGLYLSFSLGQISIAMAVTSAWISSYELYILSRILLGISMTMSLGLAAIYLAEVSPKRCRGKVGLVTGSMIQVGTVFGSIIAMPNIFGTTNLWALIYVVEFFLMLASFACLPFLPESPCLLLSKGDEWNARRAVQFFHCCDETTALKVIDEMREDTAHSQKTMGMLEVMRDQKLRKRTFVGMVVAFVMAFSGIAVINGYAVEILKQTGLSQMEASIANVGFTLISLFAVYIAAKVVESNGRRSLLLFSNICILITNVIIVALMWIFSTTQWQFFGWMLIFAIGMFTLWFSIGPGPLCYFVSTELLPLKARSAAQGWTAAVQMACRSFLLMIYLPLKNATSQSFAYAFLFVIPVALSIAFLYYELPETKNKTPSEVDEEAARLPKLCGKLDGLNVLSSCHNRLLYKHQISYRSFASEKNSFGDKRKMNGFEGDSQSIDCNGTSTPSSYNGNGMSRKSSEAAWIKLNVGGQIFQTTKMTLCREESFLSKLIRDDGGLTSDRDESGAILIDRDPQYFAPILNYLRHGKLVINPGISLEGVLHEADFYNLPVLSHMVLERIKGKKLELSQKKTVYRVLQCHGEELTNCISNLSDGWKLDQLVPVASALYSSDIQREYLCVVSQECNQLAVDERESQDRAKLLQQRARNN
ncbi:unnamed protein product, partial [Mesorhabditis belari]|uniref:Major facilitator superfamily (MFS) profile domain-containing protein n=1 Tax=Mesorhabditis belari TaxID=2138241 RepID=A0AAF3ERW9_9BILA